MDIPPRRLPDEPLNPQDGELLSAYLDGELSDQEAREVTTWLEGHPAALAEVERQRRLWDVLGRYPDEPVPVGFARRVLEQVAPAGASSLPLRRRAPWALASAATLLLAVGAGFFLLRSRGPGPDDPSRRAQLELATLEALDADFVRHADLGELLSLSDEQFALLLVAEPSALASDAAGG